MPSGTRFSKPSWDSQIAGLNFAVADGAALNTNIAVAGIKSGSNRVLKCIELSGSAAWAKPAAVTEIPNVTSDGNIQFNTAYVGTGKTLLIIWA